jgi:hypothetical protein
MPHEPAPKPALSYPLSNNLLNIEYRYTIVS